MHAAEAKPCAGADLGKMLADLLQNERRSVREEGDEIESELTGKRQTNSRNRALSAR